MSLIKLSTGKDVEMSDLETHVMLCEQRRVLSDSRIKKLEEKFSTLEEQERLNRRLLVGSLITVASGVLTTILAVVLRYYFI
jgi:hypothetical protein